MDGTDDLIKKQYNEFPYPQIPVGSMEDEVIYSANFEYVNYLCTGIFRSQKGIRILDAGCGTGYSTMKLAQQNPEATILALDFSANSLKMAGERLEKAGLTSERITFQEADLNKLEDPGEPFDYIVSTGVLHHMVSPETGLKNLIANLKDDGIMYLMLYSEFGRYFLNLSRRFIGLLQEDEGNFSEGIAIGKEFLSILQPDNPIVVSYSKSYNNIVKKFGEEFAKSDPQFVDAFVNARERTYSIDQLFDFIESNGLHFLRFQDETTWDLPVLLKNNQFLMNKAQKLSQKERYKLGEIVNTEKNFAFFAAKQNFKHKTYSEEEILGSKILRSPLNVMQEIRDKAGNRSQQIFSPIGTGLQLDPNAMMVYNLLENDKPVKAIIDDLEAKAGISQEESRLIIIHFLRNMESSGLIFFL